MSRRRISNTKHSFKRAKERTELTKDEAKCLIREASVKGKAWGNLPEGPLKEFVKKRSKYKRVKYYRGYIFVFNKTSSSCITMYPVHQYVLDDQKQFEFFLKEGCLKD